MRKILSIFILLVAILTNLQTVTADVIWEPEDDFLNANLDESVYIDCTYIAGGAQGVTKIYKSPQDGRVVSEVQNGDEIYVGWGWDDWLFTDAGWLHSDDVSLAYDSTQFFDEHETIEYTAEGTSLPSLQLYSYPNSGDSYELIEDEDYLLIGDAFSALYTDENGLQWAYINYYMQHEGWVCLADPTNSTLNSGVVATPPSLSQQRGSDAVVESADNTLLLLASGLVVAVIAITAILLLKKKKVK